MSLGARFASFVSRLLHVTLGSRRRRPVVLTLVALAAFAGIATARWTTEDPVVIWFDPDGIPFAERFGGLTLSVIFCNTTGVGEIGLQPIDDESIRVGWVNPTQQSGPAEMVQELTGQLDIEEGEEDPECGQTFVASGTVNFPSHTAWRLYAEVDVLSGESTTPSYGFSAEFPAAPPPVIDTAALNIFAVQRGACAANCFDATVSYAIPAYFSLDAPRTLSLMYSSHQAQTRHTVAIGIEDTTALNLALTSTRLRKPDNSYVTFMNDSTEMFYDGVNGSTLHGVQFEEDLATGAYDYTAEIRSWWVSGSDTLDAISSVPVRLLVVNEIGSPYGAGWSIPGLQRVHTLTSGSSVVVTGGDGSIAYFQWTGSAYVSPAADFSKLVYHAAPDTIRYERQYPDSSKAYFRSDGRLSYVDDRFGNRTGYQYNGSSQLTTVTDPVGKTITLAYTSGKLSGITDAGSRTTSITINGSGDLTQIQDPAGGKPLQNLVYSDHVLTSRTDRRGNSWKYTYDHAGKLATDSTPSVTAGGTTGRLVTTYSSPYLDYLENPASGEGTRSNPAPGVGWGIGYGEGTVTDPVGKTTTVTVDRLGTPLRVEYPTGDSVLTQRDDSNRVTRTVTASTAMTYKWSGPRLISDSNEVTGEVRKYYYHASFPTLVTRDSGRVVVNSWYSSPGKLDSTKVSGKGATKFTYDVKGRVETAISPDADTTRYYRDATTWKNTDSVKAGTRRSAQTYDGYGRVATEKNALNHVDSTFYDVLNRVTRVGGPLGHTIAYAYEDSANLTKVTDANGNIHRYEKNAVGWDTAQVDPRGKTDHFLYTKRGRVSHWVNRRGDTTAFKYDAWGRDSVRTLADGRITTFGFGEGTLGVRRWVSNAEGTDTVRTIADTTYEISVRGGVKHEAKVSFTHSTRDREVTVRRAAGWSRTVTYDYDSTGVLKRIIEPANVITTLSYTTDNQLASVALPMSDTVRHAYRFTNALARSSHTISGIQSGHGVSYNQDALGRVLEQLSPARDTVDGFEYDARGRLTARRRYTLSPACSADTTSELGAACITGSPPKVDSLLYTYDAVGNRTDLAAAIDSGNRLRRFNGDTLFYDDDGNLVFQYRLADSSVFKQRLYWNSINQLDSVQTTRSGSTTSVIYAYDGFGRRTRRTTGGTSTYYLHDGNRVVAEYTGSTLHKTYTYYPGVDQPHGMQLGSGTRYYFLSDRKGNTTGVLDSTGVVVNKYRYSPWGRLEDSVETVANTIRFASRDYDSVTGLYFNRARFYDPVAGRFAQSDPIGLEGGVNLYAYAASDPVNRRDPSGLSPSGGSCYYPGEDSTIDCEELFGGPCTSEQLAAGYRTSIVGAGGVMVATCVFESYEGATSDFIESYLAMRNAKTDGADKYFHALANCKASQRGLWGYFMAAAISDAREAVDLVTGDTFQNAVDDQAANRRGRREGARNRRGSCQDMLADLRPPSLR
jgi:RHS repeat-associated protein